MATNCLNGNTEYYDVNNCSNILTAIKASATMPYISPMIDVDGTPCLDGGCSCAIPYQWALDEGFDKIIIIKTRERGYRKQVGDRHVAERFYRKYPAFAKALDQGDVRYNKECDAVDELEQRGEAFVIAPSQPVTVGRLERDMEKLGELYWLGYEDAIRFSSSSASSNPICVYTFIVTEISESDIFTTFCDHTFYLPRSCCYLYIILNFTRQSYFLRGCKMGAKNAQHYIYIPYLSRFVAQRQMLPWQMNKIFSINFSYPKMPRYAEFCKVLSAFPGIHYS